MKSVSRILNYVLFFFPISRFLSLLGEAGSGKSSAMAKLAMDWTQNNGITKRSAHAPHKTVPELPASELGRFDYMFLIELRNVEGNIPLEKVITEQHDLGEKNIEESQIQTTLKSSKSLLIFDGYDEYKKGTNSAIDAAISGKRGNSFVLITSRPDYMSKKDKKKLDGEIQIKGLSDENIARCTENYMHDKVESKNLMQAADKSGIKELLRIPIILLMLCILSRDRRSLPVKGPLPETKTGILVEIIKLYVRRALEKTGLKQKYLLVLKWALCMVCACPYVGFLFFTSRFQFVTPTVAMVIAILYFYTGFLASLLVTGVCTFFILTWLGIQFRRLRKKIKSRGRSLTGSSILDEILYDLGELSWLALQRDTYQLLIKKVNNVLNVFLIRVKYDIQIFLCYI